MLRKSGLMRFVKFSIISMVIGSSNVFLGIFNVILKQESFLFQNIASLEAKAALLIEANFTSEHFPAFI